MLTPTEILQQVHDLTLSVADAQPLIQQMIDDAVSAAVDRDAFAMAALDGLLSTGMRAPDCLTMARKCYEQADAMMAVRSEVPTW